MEVLELLDAKGYAYIHKGGDEYAIECPNSAAHQNGKDSKPSFDINVKKLAANCFACGFSMNEEKLTRWLLGGELDDFSMETMALRARLKRLTTVEEFSATAKSQSVLVPPGNPWDEDGFRGISLDTYKKLGAIKCDRGFYSDRIVFPVYVNGKLIGVDARSLVGADPKYLRNKGSSCKTDWLHPYDIVKGMNPKYVIIAEGAFHAYNGIDKGYPVLTFFGVKNFSLTKLRMLLALGVEEVYYCKDNDAAGEKAQKEICSLLEDWLPTFCLDTSKFGEGKDLGDLTREEIQYAIDNKVRFKGST